jgi:general secretion pathway protein D
VVPGTAAPAGQAPATQAPAAQDQGAATAKPAPAGKLALSVAAPASVKINDQFNLQVNASSVQDLYNAVFVLTFDPAKLQVVTQSEGGLLKQDGAPISFQAFAANKRGELWVSTSRLGAEGTSGSGSIASVSFHAIGLGSAAIGFSNTNFSTKAGNQIPVMPFKSIVEVTQP